MHRSIYLSFVALSAVLAAWVPVSAGAQEVREAKPRWYSAPSVSKRAIETPLKSMINPSCGSAKPLQTRLPQARPLVAADQVVGIDAKGNIKVKPGAVNWHKNFNEARAASAASGKPVLSFAMIGSLDDKFC